MEPIVIDEEHREVRVKIYELLETKLKKTPNKKLQMPFSFCKEGKEHILAISSHIAKEVGIGLKTVIIKAESPWAVYSSLALLIINAGVDTGI
jgi:hypothetical protein